MRRVRCSLLAVLSAGAAGWLAPAARASPAWTPASQYPLPAGAIASSARVEFADGDVATVAYLDTGGVLHAGTIAPGRGYVQQLSIASSGTPPSLAVSPDGAAVLEWVGPDLSTFAAYRPAHRAGWDEPVTVAYQDGTLVTAISPTDSAAAGVTAAGGGFSLSTFRPDDAFATPATAGQPPDTGLALGYDEAGALTLSFISGSDVIAATGGLSTMQIVATDAVGSTTVLGVGPDGSAVVAYSGPTGTEAVIRDQAGERWSGSVVVAPGQPPVAAAISPAAAPYAIAPARQAYVLSADAGCAFLSRAPIGGGFTSSRCLPGGGAGQGGIGFIGGNAYAAWSGAGGVFGIGWRPAASAPGRVAKLSPTGSLTQALADSAGDFAALWSTGGSLTASAFETSGPLRLSASVPRTTQVDRSTVMSVTVGDPWPLAVRPPVWTFGDGTTVVGAQVSHTYARPGLYTVRVVATDALGNATVERFRVRVGGGVDDHRSR